MKRYVLIGAGLGVAIPTLWMFTYHSSAAFADWWLGAPNWVENIRLSVWPTAILLIADPLDKNVSLWVVSAALNGAIYALIGLVWGLVRRGNNERA